MSLYKVLILPVLAGALNLVSLDSLISQVQTQKHDSTKVTKTYKVFADKWKSQEVLVNWDKRKDRSYIKSGIPIMNAEDTLYIPKNVKGSYELVIYKAPNGVVAEGNKIITSSNAEEGIINGALIYRDPKTKKITESVRVIVPVFRGKIDKKKISELEEKVKNFQEEIEKITEKIADERREHKEIIGEYKELIGEQGKEIDKYKEKLKECKEKGLDDEGLEDKTRFGVSVGLGTNSELVAGAFVNTSINSWISVEGCVNDYVSYLTRKDKGFPISENKKTEVTKRERQLISPLIGSETYKERTDEITTSSEERAIAEAVVGPVFKIGNFEFPISAGAVLARREETINGKSTIIHERYGQLLEEPSVITNSKDGDNGLTWKTSLSAGARFNINKNLSVGGSFNRTGDKNSIRANLRWRF